MWQFSPGAGGRSVALNKKSVVCFECMEKVWDELVYKYREDIVNELPPQIRNRQDCWYGRACRTQNHNYAHAQKLNHVCNSSR